MLALCLTLQAHADTLLGKVINVADGDTITVLDDTHTQHKIRLTGIDAPEKRQAFGNVSKQSLVEQVAGQSVAVEWVKVESTGARSARCCWPVWIATWCRSSAVWHGTTSSISGSSHPLTNRAMQRPRSRQERRSWAYGGMLRHCLPGISGAANRHF